MSKLNINDNGVEVTLGQLEILLGKQQAVLGNFERDLILRTSGNIRIQVGNKFYDLAINGNVIGGTPTKTTLIVNNLTGLVYPGDAYFVYTTDNSTLYITVNGEYRPITSSDDEDEDSPQNIYLSYLDSQTLTGVQKNLVLHNSGLLLNNFSEIVASNPASVYQNQLIYAADTRRFYALNNNVNSAEYISWDPLFIDRQGDTVTGNLFIEAASDKGKASNISLHVLSNSNRYGLGLSTDQFNGIFVGSKDLNTGLAIYDSAGSASFISAQDRTVRFLTNGRAEAFNPLTLYEDTVGISGSTPYGYKFSVNGNTYLNGRTTVTDFIKSNDYIAGTTGTGFSIYEDSDKWYLEIDYLKLRSSSEYAGDVNDTKALNGSLFLDFSIILKDIVLYETIPIFTRAQVSGKFSDTSGTIIPLSAKGTKVNVISTAITDLVDINSGTDPGDPTYHPIDLTFGIGDMNSSGVPISGTSYIRDTTGTYKALVPSTRYDSVNNEFINDPTGTLVSSGIIYLYNISSTFNAVVGDLFFYKRWNKNKEVTQDTTMLVEVVKVYPDNIYVYAYDGMLDEGGSLIKVGNKFTDITGIELNSAENPGYIQGYKGVRSFNEMIPNYYVDEIGDGSQTLPNDILFIDPKFPVSNIAYKFEGTKINFGDKLIYNNNILTLPDYLPLAGGDMTGNIRFVNNNIDKGVYWGAQTDYGKIYFQTTGDAAGDSNLVFEVGDNILDSGQFEGFIFRKNGVSDLGDPTDIVDLLTINMDDIKYKGVSLLHPTFTGEPVIAPGTITQYWRGDKTWQTLSTAVRAITDPVYLPVTGGNMTGDITFADTVSAGIRWDRFTDYAHIFFESVNTSDPSPPGGDPLYGRSKLVFELGDDGYDQDAFVFRVHQADVVPMNRDQFTISNDYIGIDRLTDGVADNKLLTIGSDRRVREITRTDLLTDYVPKSGADMTGDIRFVNTNIINGVYWGANTDYAKIHYESTADDNNSSQMIFELGDNITGLGRREGWKFRKIGIGDPDAPTPSRDILVINDLEIIFTINGVEIGKIDETGFKLKAGKVFDSSGY